MEEAKIIPTDTEILDLPILQEENLPILQEDNLSNISIPLSQKSRVSRSESMINLERRFQERDYYMESKFESMDIKFKSMETKFELMDNKFKSMETKMDTKFESMETKLTSQFDLLLNIL